MSERVRGCVYSRFERTGPKPIFWYPENLMETTDNNLRQIAIKTINMLAADREIPESSAIVPFPKIDMVGLVKFLEIPAPNERGSAKDCSLTLLFVEEADDIIHKYFDKFEPEISKCSEIISNLEKDDKESGIEDILKSFFYAFNSKLDQILIPAEKLQILQKSLDDVKTLIQQIVESGSSSQDELQTALKLSFELNQLNVENLKPDDISKIMKIANELQVKKDMISAQQEKLRTISAKLNKKNVKRLENKLSAIVDSFDNYINDITDKVNRLGDIGTTMLFFRDFKDEAQTEQKITEITKILTHSIKLLTKFQNLSPAEQKKARMSYNGLITNRKKKKYKAVSTHALILGNIVGMTKEEILEETRDPQMRSELDKILLGKAIKVKKITQVDEQKKPVEIIENTQKVGKVKKPKKQKSTKLKKKIKKKKK
ncbi:MAG: hypothetical protein EAX96_19570 [Candidatus Lokiarchaeota archaeon]|nr:hypothetical protein [Candidatus Lokiarchaeota archaeon]